MNFIPEGRDESNDQRDLRIMSNECLRLAELVTMLKCDRGSYERELALARASSDYWRAKYIERTPGREWKPVTANMLYWFERAARSPMDDCNE